MSSSLYISNGVSPCFLFKNRRILKRSKHTIDLEAACGRRESMDDYLQAKKGGNVIRILDSDPGWMNKHEG